MTKILPFRPRERDPIDGRGRFCLARKDMFTAFREWTETKPDAAAVREEIETTANVLEQLRRLGEITP